MSTVGRVYTHSINRGLSRPSSCMTLCPWAGHLTHLASCECVWMFGVGLRGHLVHIGSQPRAAVATDVAHHHWYEWIMVSVKCFEWHEKCYLYIYPSHYIYFYVIPHMRSKVEVKEKSPRCVRFIFWEPGSHYKPLCACWDISVWGQSSEVIDWPCCSYTCCGLKKERKKERNARENDWWSGWWSDRHLSDWLFNYLSDWLMHSVTSDWMAN